MSVEVLELLLHLLIFLTTAYLIFVFFLEFGDKTQDFRKQSVASGDSVLSELYIGMSPETFFFVRVFTALLLFLFGVVILNIVIAALLAALGFFVPFLMLRRAQRRRVRRVEAQLVEALELLGNSLKSGLTLQQAVELVVREFPPPISQEFALVLSETRLGVDFSEGLERMAARLDSNVLYILATGVAIVKQCGGDMTQIFSSIAGTIREQATIEGKLDAVTAQGRYQGLILGMMPFALMVVLYFIDPSHVETLFRYQIGIWAFSGVVVMILLAQLWIRKLLAIDV